MDLKIEITKLYALHNATIQLEHGIREFGKTTSRWRDFAPSRFIYAYFTFNSIYSFDWANSFSEMKAIYWGEKEEEKIPKEEVQIKFFLKFVYEQLGEKSAIHFQAETRKWVKIFGVQNPIQELEKMDLINATKKVEQLGKQFPGNFSNIYNMKLMPTDFYSVSCVLLEFIYKVRCNLFHGRKTRIELLDKGQQKRLLIYTALLIATNNLLFECANSVGWLRVPVNPEAPHPSPQ